MSQVTKSASAFVRAFLAILVLELEDMVVRLVRPPKLASVHGYRWTVRLGYLGKLVQRLDRRDVLTDEPRDVRRMGLDHEMSRAGNGHQRRSRDCVTQHLGDTLNGWRR